MVQRRLPRPSELAPLLRPAPFVRDATARRLRRAASVGGPAADRPAAHPARGVRLLRRRRRRRAVAPPRPGGVRPGRVPPSVLHDVSTIDTSRDILGKRAALPFAFAPTGFTRMMQTEGERAVASVAQEIGVPLHAVDDGHHDHRGPRRLRPRRPAVVPALPLARPVVRQGPRPTRRGGGLRHAHAHRGHPVGRGAPPRRPQRPRDPARAHAQDVRRRRDAPQLVVRPAHHRAARRSRRSRRAAPRKR